jgi:hypothetical protein
MPATKSLKIVERVIVAGLDVIGLVRGLAAEDADGVASLAAVAVPPQHPDSARAPVRGEAGLTGACLPAHYGTTREGRRGERREEGPLQDRGEGLDSKRRGSFLSKGEGVFRA